MTVRVPELITPPAAPVITLAEAKAHARYDLPDEDALILGYVETATQKAESFLNRALINRGYRITLDRWVSRLPLPMPPLVSVESVKYDDENDAEQTVDPGNYWISTTRLPGEIFFNPQWDFPTLTASRDVDRIRIEFTAGYGVDPTNVPMQIRQGVNYTTSHYFRNRESIAIGAQVSEIPGTAEALLWPYRVVPI